MRRLEVPIEYKVLLILDEASSLFNIGVNKLRELTNESNCPYVLFVGSKRLIKRIKLEEYLLREYSI